MSQPPHTHTDAPPDPLDELVDHLVNCGGVLSQMVADMLEYEASGRSSPDAAPIPEIMRTLVRSAVDPLARQHSKRDIRVAGKIVDQVTEAICSEIFCIPPEAIDAIENGDLDF